MGWGWGGGGAGHGRRRGRVGRQAVACGVVACLAAMALMAASSVSGGEAWKALIAFCPPPMDECAVARMPCSPQ